MEDTFQVEGRGEGEGDYGGEAWFSLARDRAWPPSGLDVSSWRRSLPRGIRQDPRWAVRCSRNRKLPERARQSKWKFQLHVLRIDLWGREFDVNR